MGKIFTKNNTTAMLRGLGNTAIIALLGFIIGIIIGSCIATVKASSKDSKTGRVFSKIGDIYVAFFRGTPIVVQLLLFYYVLFPKIGLSWLDRLAVAVIVFGLNSGAYVAEIIRAGVGAVDVGQYEAGRSLGLSTSKTLFRIVLPQAFKNSIPALGNELIALVKDTSVAGFISVIDITAVLNSIATARYEYTIPYLILGGIYLVIVIVLTMGIKRVEKKLSVSDRNK